MILQSEHMCGAQPALETNHVCPRGWNLSPVLGGKRSNTEEVFSFYTDHLKVSASSLRSRLMSSLVSLGMVSITNLDILPLDVVNP